MQWADVCPLIEVVCYHDEYINFKWGSKLNVFKATLVRQTKVATVCFSQADQRLFTRTRQMLNPIYFSHKFSMTVPQDKSITNTSYIMTAPSDKSASYIYLSQRLFLMADYRCNIILLAQTHRIKKRKIRLYNNIYFIIKILWL